MSKKMVSKKVARLIADMTDALAEGVVYVKRSTAQTRFEQTLGAWIGEHFGISAERSLNFDEYEGVLTWVFEDMVGKWNGCDDRVFLRTRFRLDPSQPLEGQLAAALAGKERFRTRLAAMAQLMNEVE